MATGPIHGVELITKPLHLAGGMMQAMPSREDIDRIRASCDSDRLIAAYEILTHHYQSAMQEVETLKAENARLREAIMQAETLALAFTEPHRSIMTDVLTTALNPEN